MRITTFVFKTLRYHGRTNLAVLLGVVTGSAALTGALIVGDSMRASLRDKALERLGPVDYALLANRFVRERLADDLAASAALARDHDAVVPLIRLRAAATRPDTQARANRVHVLGVDARFWSLAAVAPPQGVPDRRASRARSVVLNATLAARLDAGVGDDILLRIGKPADVPIESLLGRRDNTTVTLRLAVCDVLSDTGLGAFNLNPDQRTPANAYVPLPILQRALHKAGRVNTLLFAAPHTPAQAIRALLAEQIDLADLGVRLRTNDALGYVAIESDAVLVPPEIEAVARPAARELGQTINILTYLANDLRVVGPAPTSGPEIRSVPYSTVAAIDALPPGAAPFEHVDGHPAAAPKPGEILLNDWTARRLHARIGDKIRLSYFVTDALGRLDTRAEDFTLAGIVRLDGAAADPDFAPDYPGITDTRRLADWDPPFPIDLGRIGDDDEDYWKRYRTTPKAFIALADGRRLWASDAARFGRITACRLYPTRPDRLAREADALAQHLRGAVDLDRLGLALMPVRRQAVAAGAGSTEFGGLFIGFSFFLIFSACLLVALLFRLGVERRSASVGLLLATGFSNRQVSRILLAEGAVLAVAGSAVGLPAAIAYAGLMLAGLRTGWSDAVHAPFLRLHATPAGLLIGFAAGAGVALAAIAWSLRGLTRQSPRALLAGATPVIPWTPLDHPARRSTVVALLAAAVALALVAIAATTDALPPAPTFFSSGALLLIAALAAVNRLLRCNTRRSIQRPGAAALAMFGLRNTRRHAGRSLLTIALVASATFVIAAMQVFRLNVGDADSTDKSSPTGGFPLYAESATPLPYDLNTPAGRESLGILEPAARALDGVRAIPFRLRTGDEASCLNLYKPAAPRILGAPEAMIRRGGFSFAATMAESPVEKNSPWTLLNRTFPDDAVPVIGDEAAVLWQLHLGLGKDLITTDERGRKVPLRFVALLRGSVLQGELVIAESRFKQLFPSVGGYGFFLIEIPPQAAAGVERTLERELAAYGFDVAPTADRLRDYYAVQNTYLSTFQTLGGFGLVLGTIGMAAVLLRNTWERRGELALMLALGFSHAQVRRFVLTETAALIVAGLIAGGVPALVAVAPFAAAHAGSISWQQLGALLAGVLAVGLSACIFAVRSAVRGNLIAALRSE